AGGSFDDLMHLADLARERNAHLEARAYLKAAMARAADRPEPYYWLGYLAGAEGDAKRGLQYYYMAFSARKTYEPVVAAFKCLGKIHCKRRRVSQSSYFLRFRHKVEASILRIAAASSSVGALATTALICSRSISSREKSPPNSGPRDSARLDI